MTQQQPLSIKGMTVLLADDDDAMRAVLHQALRICELQVIGQAVDGRQAVELYRKLQPQIVCLDVDMPELNGLDALKAIRAEGADVVVVLITGAATSTVVKEAIAAGVNGVIGKPISVQRVRDEITRCVQRAQQRKDGVP